MRRKIPCYDPPGVMQQEEKHYTDIMKFGKLTKYQELLFYHLMLWYDA